MEIIECSPEMEIDRMYCPSTDEVIFAPGYESINEDAKAFIAQWNAEILEEPTINDESLETAWEKFYNEDLAEKLEAGEYIWDDFRNFLRNYENPEWIVYECDFYGMACGPTTTTLVFVVKADTIIEEDPDYDEETAGNDPFEGMSEKEIEDEIIARQLRSLLG